MFDRFATVQNVQPPAPSMQDVPNWPHSLHIPVLSSEKFASEKTELLSFGRVQFWSRPAAWTLRALPVMRQTLEELTFKRLRSSFVLWK